MVTNQQPTQKRQSKKSEIKTLGKTTNNEYQDLKYTFDFKQNSF